MTRKETSFETIADMVEWVVSNNYYATKKFGLSDRTDQVWDDEEVGKEWQENYDAVNDLLWKARYHNEDGNYTAQDIAEMETKLDEIRKVIPSKHNVTWYWLDEKTGDSWGRGRTIHLSPAVGKLIAGVWTMVPAYRGSSYTKYSPQGLTIPGILRRLGLTDVGDQIAAEQARVKAENEKNSRNYSRREVEKLAKQLIDEMKKGLDKGVEFPVHLSELVDLSQYMEE